jgi:hypothetical protein
MAKKEYVYLRENTNPPVVYYEIPEGSSAIRNPHFTECKRFTAYHGGSWMIGRRVSHGRYNVDIFMTESCDSHDTRKYLLVNLRQILEYKVSMDTCSHCIVNIENTQWLEDLLDRHGVSQFVLQSTYSAVKEARKIVVFLHNFVALDFKIQPSILPSLSLHNKILDIIKRTVQIDAALQVGGTDAVQELITFFGRVGSVVRTVGSYYFWDNDRDMISLAHYINTYNQNKEVFRQFMALDLKDPQILESPALQMWTSRLKLMCTSGLSTLSLGGVVLKTPSPRNFSLMRRFGNLAGKLIVQIAGLYQTAISVVPKTVEDVQFLAFAAFYLSLTGQDVKLISKTVRNILTTK